MGTGYGAKLRRYRLKNHESMADAHPQNPLPGKDTRLKTTQAFFKISCELYVTTLSLSEEVKFSAVRKFSKFLVCSITNCSACPVNLILLRLSMFTILKKQSYLDRHLYFN